MAGTLTVDTIQSDSSYVSTLNVASKINFTSGMQIGGQDTTFGGMRNRVINGDMRIAQRGTSAFTSTTSSLYTLDRWTTYGSGGSQFTVQQNAGSITPPVGFTNYLGVVNSATPTTPSGSQEYDVYQYIEGYNIADLGWGTANAKPVTLSFWVRSSITGTFGASLGNSGSSRTYPFNYTISSSNTWEQKTVTIPGDTSGTWLTDNGAGISLTFSLGAGSTKSGTANTWAGANYTQPTGSTALVSTASATWQLTGVQLEKGSVASAFEQLHYGHVLALCQRYYQKSYPQSVAVGSAFNYSASGIQINGVTYSYYGVSIQLKQTMRASPTLTTYSHTGVSGGLSSDGGGSLTSQSGASVNALNINENGFFAALNNISSFGMQFAYTVSSEL